MDFNYRLIWPDRCCGNCAYGSYSEKEKSKLTIRRCAWMDFVFSSGGNSLLAFISTLTPDFDRCGLCDKWIPRGLALCAKDSSSFDEFRLKKTVAGFDQFQTDEFDDWFAERKATPAQLRAVKKIAESKHIAPPAMV